MKHLIYFLLFSTAVFSQNYHYAIDETQIILQDAPTNFVVSNLTQTTVDLTWTAPVDNTSVTDYKIYNNSVLLAISTGTGTSFTVTGLSPATTYALTVRAVDSKGNLSVDSNPQTFTTDNVVIAPIAPTNFVVSNLTQTSVDLTWTAPIDNSSVTDYKIYNNSVLLAISTGTGTSFTVTGLSPATTYALTVRAVDSKGNLSVDSNKQIFTTDKVVSSPANLIVSNIGQTSVDLTWTAPVDNSSVTDYKIYNNSVLLAISTGTGTSFTLTGLTPATSYALSVRAVDAKGNLSVDSNKQIFTTDNVVIAPNSPTNLVVSNLTQTSVDLTWTAPVDNSSVTDYKIYNNSVLLATSAGTGTNFTVIGLTPATSYNLTVKAVDTKGNLSVDSNKQTFTTDKVVSPPTNLIVSNIGQTSVDLTWTAPVDNSSVIDYKIYNNSVLLATSAGTGTSFTVTELTPATSYNLTVKAVDAKGNLSVDSNKQIFTTDNVVIAPNSPTNLVVSNLTQTSVDLTWTAPVDNSSVTDYKIYNNDVLLTTSAGIGTSFTVIGLTPATSYNLTVKAVDTKGNVSVDSNKQTFTTDKVVSPPTNLIISNITQTSVNLTWTAPVDNSSVTDYKIYNNSVLLTTSAGIGTSFTVRELTPATSYNLTVKAVDTKGNVSVDSNKQTFTTDKVVSPPTNLIVSNITQTSVDLTWTAPVDNSSVTDYKIYNNSVLLATSTGIETSYKVTGLSQGTTYNLAIKAVDAKGNLSVDSNSQTVTTDNVVAAPTNLVASNITQTTVDLKWTAAANASVTDYKIYNNTVLLATAAGTGTSFSVTGLAPATSYTFTVKAVDAKGTLSVDSNLLTVTTGKLQAGVNNQIEEIEYYKAYLLPIAEKANLQKAIDTYGSVRLEKGNYKGVNVVMHSNQRLYGDPSLTVVSNITIAAGSSNVHLEDLLPADSFITLQAGGVISNCTFKSIKWAILKGTNVMLENCTFINYLGHIQLDCSQSGYIRNNKIIKHQSGTVSNVLVMKGNSITPSYGNVNLWSNYLTPHGDATDIDNLQSATFVGMDAEAWNLAGEGAKAMFYAKNMGNVKITDFNGGNGGSPFKTPSYDIDATNVFFLNKYLNYPTDVISLRTNMFMVNAIGPYIRKTGSVTGFDLLGNLEFSNTIKYNGVEQTTTMTNSTVINNLKNTILGTQYTPWARPSWETMPDPLGPNWRTERVGKPDQTAYIQNLIDTNGVAQLPEGIFYIGSTLKIPTDSRHGIIGQGTGKTALVGLTDNFPIISLMGSSDGSIQLAHLTIQGGAEGVYASMDYGKLNIAWQNMKFVVFRDQNYGIHLKRTGGFDNCFLENLAFMNCKIGFYQEPTPGDSGENNSAYVDKTMFYKNQFINCNTAISMLATRADNLDAWVDCKFDGGQTALALAGQNAPIVANCDFTNFNGKNVINTNAISMYNSNVYNNNISGSTIVASYTNIEGCNFLDNSPMFSPMLYTSLHNHIINSTISGDVLAHVPANQGYGKESAVYTNSTLLSNPTLSKLLVNLKEGVPTIIINETPNPYPQLLVKH